MRRSSASRRSERRQLRIQAAKTTLLASHDVQRHRTSKRELDEMRALSSSCRSSVATAIKGERDGHIKATVCRSQEYQESCEGRRTEANSGAPAEADENSAGERGREGC